MAITIIAAFAAVRYFLRMFTGAPFSENIAFYKNILLAQYAVLVIQYGCYIWLNKGVIAQLPLPGKVPVTRAKQGLESILFKYGVTALQLIAIIYLLGPVSNIIEYFGTKNFPGPAMANSISGVLPAHPQEPYNIFGGFDITAFFVSIYIAYALMRELVIYAVEKANNRLLYTAIVNQFTLLALLLVAVYPLMFIILPADIQGPLGVSVGTLLYVLAPTILGVYVAEAYWLFPQKGNRPLLRSGINGKLLMVTAICAMPVVFLHNDTSSPWSVLFTWWLFHLVITTPLSWMVYQQRKDKILQLRDMEQDLTRSKADIQFLRSQINPHFLFNVLNTIYGTALQEKATRTAESIQMLGDMMRFMLHDNTSDVIPMEREIEYLQNYIALQSLRIQSSPNITLQTNISTPGCNHNIAPMLLIPFVENAFKHGISLREPSWIKIDLRCDEHNVWFNVHNSMHPRTDNDTEKIRSGIGIINVKKRLQASYPNKHTLVYNADGSEFFVQLNIQF